MGEHAHPDTHVRTGTPSHVDTQGHTHTDLHPQTLLQPQVSRDGRFTLTPWVTKGKTSGLFVP